MIFCSGDIHTVEGQSNFLKSHVQKGLIKDMVLIRGL